MSRKIFDAVGAMLTGVMVGSCVIIYSPMINKIINEPYTDATLDKLFDAHAECIKTHGKKHQRCEDINDNINYHLWK